jgi:hypothetical protein
MIGGGANAILILDELEPGLLEGILDVSDHQSRQRLLRIGFHYDPQMEQVSLIYVGVHSLKGGVKDWKRIRSQIDINAYSDSIPLTAREIGQVRFGTASYPTEIRWVDGRFDRIRLDRVHRTIAGARTGQFVEAWVERDPLTKQISQIVLAERIGSLHALTQEQAAVRWARLPQANLPTTDWDWPDRELK